MNIGAKARNGAPARLRPLRPSEARAAQSSSEQQLRVARSSSEQLTAAQSGSEHEVLGATGLRSERVAIEPRQRELLEELLEPRVLVDDLVEALRIEVQDLARPLHDRR